MKTRQFLIPALSALSVTMTSGCADPLVNDWEGVELTSENSVYDLPYTDEYTDNGTTYSFRFQLYLSIDEDFEGEFSYVSEYTYDGQTYESEYAYDIEASEDTRRNYTIEVQDLDFTMDCELDTKTFDTERLVCEHSGDDAVGDEIQWVESEGDTPIE